MPPLPRPSAPLSLVSLVLVLAAGLAGARAQTTLNTPTVIFSDTTYSQGVVIANGLLPTTVTVSANVATSGSIVDSGSLVITPTGFWASVPTLRINPTGTMSIQSGGQATSTNVALYGQLVVGGIITAAQFDRWDVAGALTLDGGTVGLSNNQPSLFTGFSAGTLVLGPGGGTIRTNNWTATAVSGFTGTGDFTKAGAGSLILAAANTFTGNTTVSGGTLRYGVADALPATSAVTVAAGASLELQSYQVYLGSLAGAGIVQVNGSLTLGSTNDSSTFAGTVFGTGSLVKVGTGTLTLSGTNTLHAGVTVGAGTLRLGSNTALPSTVSPTLNAGATLDLNGFAVSVPTVLGTGTVALGGGSISLGATSTTSTFAGTLSGTGNVIKTGSGTLTLAQGASADTHLFLNSGTLVLPVASTPGTLAFSAGTLDLGGLAHSTSVFDYSAGTILNGTLTVTGSAMLRTDFALGSGSPPVTLAPSASLTVRRHGAPAVATFAGGTQATSSITLGGLADTDGRLVVSGGTWNNAGDLTIGRLGAGVFTLGAGTFTTGTIGLARAGGSAFLNLNGGTLVTGGLSRVPETGVTSTGGIVIFNSGTLRASASTPDWITGFTGDTAIISSTLPVDTQAFDVGIPSTLSGAGSLLKQGTGTLTFSGPQTYRGATTVSAGTLELGTGSHLATPSITLLAGTRLTDTRTDSQALGASISGAGELLKSGSGTLSLVGSLTHTGGTSVTGGTLALVGGANLSQPNLDLAVTGTGTLRLAGGSATVAKVLLGQGGTGTLVLDSGTLATATVERWSGPSTATFNGGTLRATGDHTAFLNGFTAGSAVLGTTGLTLDSNGFAITVPAEFSGSGGLVKTGAGTLTLTGANTHTGPTLVSAGTLALAADSALGAAGGPLTVNGATVLATGTFATNRPVTLLGNATLAAAAGATLTASGTVSGSGSLAKSGAGTLVLGGAGTYSGATSVAGGTLALGAAGGFSDLSTFTVAPGAVLDLAGTTETIGALAGSGLVALGSATLTTGGNHASTTFSGSFTGTGGLTKTGTGTFTLQSAGLAGPVRIAAGTLALAADLSAAPVTVDTGATLSGTGSLGSLAGSGTVAGSAGGFTVGALGTSTTFSGTFSHAGSLEKVGAGTLTLSGSGTVAGLTDARSGTLAFTGANLTLGSALRLGFGGTGSATVTNATLTLPTLERWNVASTLTLDGATLRATGNHPSFLNGFNAGSAVLGTGGLTVDSAGFSLGFSANTALSGAGGLTKNGSGTLTLSTAHTYTGPTVVNGGTLALTGTVGTGAFVVNGGTLDLGGVAHAVGTLTVTGGNLANGTVSAGTVGLSAGTFAGSVSASTSVDISGPVTVAATGAIAAASAPLRVEKSGGGSAALTVAGGSVSSASLAVGAASGSNGSLTVSSGSVTSAGVVSVGGAGTGALAVPGGVFSAPSVLLGFGGGTGTLSADGGVLEIGALERWSVASSASFNGGTLRATADSSAWLAGFTAGSAVIRSSGLGLDTAGFSVTVPAEFTGAGGIVKGGAGTLSLSGTNTYFGGTTISAGTLRLAGSGSITGPVVNHGTFAVDRTSDLVLTGTFLGSGALLKSGSGTLTFAADGIAAGPVTVSGGTLALLGPGAVFGSLAGSGSLSLGGTSLSVGSAGTATTFSGTLSGTGSFTKTGSGTLVLSGPGTFTGATVISAGTLTLADGATTATSSIANSGTLTVDRTSDLTFAGTLSGSGALQKSGAGTFTLSGNNVAAGHVTVAAGTLALAGSAPAFGSLAGSGSVSLDGNTLTVGSANTDTTFTGALTGSGSLALTGTGALTLSGNTLTLAQLSAAQASAGVVFSGVILRPAAASTAFLSGFAAGRATLAGSGLTLDTQNLAVTTPAALSGTGTFNKVGTGTLTLSGAHTYTGGTTVAAGTLALAAGGSLAHAAADIAVANTGTATLRLDGGSATAAKVVLGHDGGTGSLVLGSGTLTTTAVERWSVPSTVTFDGGTLRAAADTTALLAGFSAGTAVLGTSGLTLDTQAFAVTVPTDLSGTGSLTKTGTGTLTLSGANTFAGSTSFEKGTTLIPAGATLSHPGSTLYVGSLGGAGTVEINGGAVTTGVGAIAFFGGFTGTVRISSGSWTSTGLEIGRIGVGTLHQTGGTVDTGSVNLGQFSGSGSLVLEGGTFRTSGIERIPASFGTLTANGGTLRATADNPNFLVGFGSGNAVLGAGGLTVDTVGFSIGIPSSLSGTGSLIKTGTGTLTLSGSNTYTGTTTLAGGTLSLAGGSLLHPSGELVVASTGTGTFALSGGASLSAAKLVLGHDGGTATATLGAGTVTTTAIERWSVPSSISFNGTTLRAAAAAPALLAGFGAGSAVIGAGGLTVDTNGFNATIPSSLTGTGGLTKSGAGTLTLSGANAFAGSTSFENGTTLIPAGATLSHPGFALSVGRLGGAGTVEIDGGTVATGTGAIAFFGGFTGTVRISAGSWTSTGLEIGRIGNGTLHQTGGTVETGSVRLGQFNGTGSLVLEGGTFRTSGIERMPASFGTLTANGGTLRAAADAPLLLTGFTAGTAVLNAGGLTVDTAGFNAGFSANTVLSGTGGLTKTGTGTLTLAGSSTYTGTTTLAAGTLAVSANAHLGATTAPVAFTGGTLRATSAFLAARATTLGTGGGTFLVDSGATLTWSGAVTGAAGNALAKTGLGTLVLSGANTYSGDTLVQAGTLRLGAANALSPNTTLHVASGATFDPAGYTTTFAALAGSGTIDTGSTGLSISPSALNTYSGTLSGSGGLTMSGSGTLELSGTNTYAGTTTVSSGTLQLAAADALPAGTPLSLSAGATLNLNGYAATLGSLSGAGSIALGSATLAVAQAGNSTWAGALSGTGGLTKSGAGTLTLAGTHSFTGATAVNAGRLHLTGSAPASAFSVGPGAILSGTGSLGALTVAGTVSPGASPGTLSAGNTVFAGGGSFTWEVNNATGSAGTHYDLLSITGTLDVAATSANRFTVNLVSLLPDNSPGAVINFSPTQNYTYTFATTTGGILGFAPTDFTVNTAGFTNALAGGAWSVGQSGNTLTLNFTAASAIPEPSTYAALFGLAALALAAHRRRARTAGGQR